MLASPPVETVGPREGSAALADARWDALAEACGSPFLTREWLEAWWRSFGKGRLEPIVLRSGDGAICAAAALARPTRTTLASPANDHSGSWDVLATDDARRDELWRSIASLRPARFVLRAMPEAAASGVAPVLRQAGFRVLLERGPFSPYLRLPASFEELLASRSRNLRSQVGRRRRALERAGALVFRTTTGGETLDADLDAFIRIEASGWKTAAHTSISSDPGSVGFYRAFAHAAAERGWLRLRLLELDGEPIAGDLSVAFAGGEFLLKTGFDERHARSSPGLVLRADVLAAAIGEGLGFYDFLGAPDTYKLRWTEEIRPRVTLRAYRGIQTVHAYAYRKWLRPALKSARSRARSRA